MKYPIRWLVLLVIIVTAISVYMGCATMLMTEVVYKDKGHPYKSHVLTDEIVAIGKPDATLTRELSQDDCIAFIGQKKTYLLNNGGKELWQIAQLKLDAARMETDAAESQELFLDENRVWGKLTVSYDGGKPLSVEEESELLKAGFASDNSPNHPKYLKTITIAGWVYPAIKGLDEQMPKLKRARIIKFYANKYSGETVVAKIVKAPLILVGVAVDTVLLPVYVIGLVGAMMQ